ncbi:unnamed protein product [Heterosigma akashiwo]
MENLRWIVDYWALGLRRYNMDGFLAGLADGFESLISEHSSAAGLWPLWLDIGC